MPLENSSRSGLIVNKVQRGDTKTLYLVDASPYIFRAYFSLPETIVNPRGRPVNAVYGYTHFLCELVERTRPQFMAVAFDESLSHCFRNDLYPPYKANRDPPPADLAAQLKACQAITHALGIKTYASDRFEADDIIGTIGHRLRRRSFRMVYVSSDKDLAQLVSSKDVLWDYARDRRFTPAAIRRHFGVAPDQFVDYLALMGDAVDNIPGVPKVGAKSAVQLLKRFGTLVSLYDRIDEVEKIKLRGAGTIRRNLETYREQAFLSQQLARIYTGVPLRCSVEQLRRKRLRRHHLEALMEDLGFGGRLNNRIGRIFA